MLQTLIFPPEANTRTAANVNGIGAQLYTTLEHFYTSRAHLLTSGAHLQTAGAHLYAAGAQLNFVGVPLYTAKAHLHIVFIIYQLFLIK